MKIYMAAQYQQKEEIKAYADQAQAGGIEVTSRWLLEPHAPNAQMAAVTEDDLESYAINDLADIDRADMFVFFSLSDQTPFKRGGRHVEFGYALAKSKPILVVGPKENIFHCLHDRVRHVETWKIALTQLLLTQAVAETNIF
jgi:nucleoside 2-deoxyribosyltransferase